MTAKNAQTRVIPYDDPLLQALRRAHVGRSDTEQERRLIAEAKRGGSVPGEEVSAWVRKPTAGATGSDEPLSNDNGCARGRS